MEPPVIPSPSPSWPSLYNFLIEIVPFEGRGAVQPAGKYLYDPEGEKYVNSGRRHTKESYRRLPLHLVLDHLVLHPTVRVRRCLCLSELDFPTITVAQEVT